MWPCPCLCVFENVLTALVYEELSNNCPFQYISTTCNRNQNPPFSGYIYHEHNTDYKYINYGNHI